MTRHRLSSIALALLLAGPWGCKEDAPKAEAGPTPDAKPEKGPELAPSTEDPPPPPPVVAAKYDVELRPLLDMVPAGAEAHLVVRDLGPFLAVARQAEAVMAGPLTRAVAGMGEFVGEDALVSVGKAHVAFVQILHQIEKSGVEFGAGFVFWVNQKGDAGLSFAAEKLDGVQKLVESMGLPPETVGRFCKPQPNAKGRFLCLEEPDEHGTWAPGAAGAAATAQIQKALPGVELERVNVSFHLNEPGVDVVGTTDPGLFEVAVAVDNTPREFSKAMQTGPARALRGLRPGDGFMWARTDLSGVGAGARDAPPPLRAMIDSFDGEMFMGVHRDPNAMLFQVGVKDPGPARDALELAASFKDEIPKSIPGDPGSKLSLEIEEVQAGGETIKALVLDIESAQLGSSLSQLGLANRMVAFVAGGYVNLAIGGDTSIVGKIATAKETGPTPTALAALPPHLAEAISRKELTLALHMPLDALQSVDGATLDGAMAELPKEMRPSGQTLVSILRVFAPISELSFWATEHGDRPVFHAGVRLFADDRTEEGKATLAALAAIYGGADARATYAALAEQYKDSPRAHSFKVRAAATPDLAASMGMAIVGVGAAVAIPALSKYMRRAKTAEAKANLAKMFDATAAYLQTEHAKPGSTETTTLQCPTDGKAAGAVAITPPLTIDCNGGPGGRCVPVTGKPEQPWQYSISQWTDNAVWSGLNFQMEQAHYFHYGFRWSNGPKTCEFTVQAFGDLDGDQVFSTYERSGAADVNGVNAAAGLYIDQEVE